MADEDLVLRAQMATGQWRLWFEKSELRSVNVTAEFRVRVQEPDLSLDLVTAGELRAEYYDFDVAAVFLESDIDAFPYREEWRVR